MNINCSTFVKDYLKTIGEGTQNLTRVFLMFSCNVFSSKHHDVCSLADGPAVGSFKTNKIIHDNIIEHLGQDNKCLCLTSARA